VRGVVIDGRLGYTGGFGIDDHWLGDGRSEDQWRDTNVRFEGPAVLQLQAGFAAAWTEATGELLVGSLYFPLAASIGSRTAADTRSEDPTPVVPAPGPGRDRLVMAGLLHAAPSMGSTEAERLLALTIASARRTLYIANAYAVPGEYQRLALIRAVRRGVDVRLLLPGEKTDVALTRFAAHAFYEQLLSGGVRIWEYQPTMMHAKTFVVDGIWSSIGSMNFDNRSLVMNDESNLLVLDAGFGATMDSMFMTDLDFAREIRLPDFRGRSVLVRLREWAASRLVNLL
jgi:cardiolipin synthase